MKIKKIVSILFTSLLLFLAVLILICVVFPWETMIEPEEMPMIETYSEIYLPVIINRSFLAGVEWEGTAEKAEEWHVDYSPIRLSCRWLDAESQRGVYDWSICDAKIGDYRPFILTVKNTPYWALEPGAATCELPDRQYWPDFATWVQMLIDRYHPVYIEFWNEPDSPRELMPQDHYLSYGCLGYDGGLEYGEFVTYLVDHTEGTKIAAGALSHIDNGFLFDMLETAIGFDALTFHCYAGLYAGLHEPCVLVYEKIKNIWPKVILSETGVIYKRDDNECSDEYYAAQVTHFEIMAASLDTEWIWYTLNNNGWPKSCSTDMIWLDSPRPVYYEYVAYYE